MQSSVFDIAKKQVGDQQANRSDMIKSMEMPSQGEDQFAGMDTDQLAQVNVKKLDSESAKKWAAAMEAAKDAADQAKTAPVAPAPTAAPQGTAAVGGPVPAAAAEGVALM